VQLFTALFVFAAVIASCNVQIPTEPGSALESTVIVLALAEPGMSNAATPAAAAIHPRSLVSRRHAILAAASLGQPGIIN
jgi:hypothetical protein